MAETEDVALHRVDLYGSFYGFVKRVVVINLLRKIIYFVPGIT
jgi:hypothetical protein